METNYLTAAILLPEADAVRFLTEAKTDALGAVERTTVCRRWTAFTVFAAEDRFSPWYQYTDNPNGTYWCTSRIEKARESDYWVTVGVPFEHVKWLRGRETTNRSQSSCPDERCCKSAERPRREVGASFLAGSQDADQPPRGAPAGTFPGVDEVEGYSFLQAHEPC